MATVLDKALKRQITVDGADYIVALDSEGFRVTIKGRRNPQVELRWHDLVSGDAALAVALNASLSPKTSASREKTVPEPVARPVAKPTPERARRPARKSRR